MNELNNTLRETIKHHTMDEPSLDGDNTKVKYYMGLPYFSTLMALFNSSVSCSREEGCLVKLSTVSGGADEAAP